MGEIVADLVDVHRGNSTGRETRQIAWLLLIRLAADGVPEAQTALKEINRAARQRRNDNFRRPTATIGDSVNIKTKG